MCLVLGYALGIKKQIRHSPAPKKLSPAEQKLKVGANIKETPGETFDRGKPRDYRSWRGYPGIGKSPQGQGAFLKAEKERGSLLVQKDHTQSFPRNLCPTSQLPSKRWPHFLQTDFPDAPFWVPEATHRDL